MKRLLLLSGLLIVFLAISISFYFKNISAQENQPSTDSSAIVIEKLDKILSNQTLILNQIGAMRDEIRARCTR